MLTAGRVYVRVLSAVDHRKQPRESVLQAVLELAASAAPWKFLAGAERQLRAARCALLLRAHHHLARSLADIAQASARGTPRQAPLRSIGLILDLRDQVH